MMVVSRRKYLFSLLVVLLMFSQSIYLPAANAATVQEVDFRSDNYPNNYIEGSKAYDRVVKVSPTVTSYRLHFARIGLANGDRVSVSSSYNSTTQEAGTIYYYSNGGYTTDVWTPWITGPAYVNLITNKDGLTSTGYVIDQIEYNGTSSPNINSAAFFPNSFSSVSNISVYQAPTVSTYGYSSYVTNALNQLDNISNANIGYTNSTSTTAQVRISANNNSALDYFALVQPYDSSGKAINETDSKTWSYATMVLNHGVMTKWGFTASNKQGTVTHEVGHLVSLSHQMNLDANSIMKTGKKNNTTFTSLDISNIQYRW
ncbi:hypothetical protein [Paenibacillus xylanilyticus]|uniref:Peptidase M10 metallopeptidase domain-containing protein n=1 Tax=Paenibacillus xylanilyticus TaxID=248903 RepID=A0A7Y6BVG9_9BACL|nr:hypothetical protein [Paenibacillus xylanilyticus]NUU75747.1 hypothetical protein [Paenibacillus xylanilyticus]